MISTVIMLSYLHTNLQLWKCSSDVTLEIAFEILAQSLFSHQPISSTIQTDLDVHVNNHEMQVVQMIYLQIEAGILLY